MHTTIFFQGRTIEFDEHGYLADINNWTEDLAVYLSERDSLELKTDHWEVIHFMRDYFKEYQITPMAKIIVKKMNKQIGKEKYNVKYLYKLFPRTPVTHACKYAGLPRPSGCT
ncbi:MAG: TusE/DsrC/DsvC family sulfur relay protein [Planctomycetota bacterium]|jgi:tRNA 2-thiouridine synthesizing protein E